MTLLIGAAISLIVQFGKWLIGKFGYEAARITILITVFVLSVAFSLLTYNNILTPHFISVLGTILAGAIATYELILKNIMPAYNALFGNKSQE